MKQDRRYSDPKNRNGQKIKNASQKFATKIRQNKEPQGDQSNKEFYVIYKSGPLMSESRFLEASLFRQADGSLKMKEKFFYSRYFLVSMIKSFQNMMNLVKK